MGQGGGTRRHGIPRGMETSSGSRQADEGHHVLGLARRQSAPGAAHRGPHSEGPRDTDVPTFQTDSLTGTDGLRHLRRRGLRDGQPAGRGVRMSARHGQGE